MINRDDIETGDKCFTRDGGCLVAREVEGFIKLLNYEKGAWHQDGSWNGATHPHPLDIIRIEKAPKPVVVKLVIVSDDGKQWSFHLVGNPTNFKHAIKLVFVNGVWDKEKSEQVK